MCSARASVVTAIEAQATTGSPAADPEQIERLFDDARDPQERVRPDDWHPSPDSGFPELDGWDTVAKRRHWYLTLIKEGLL